MLDARALSRVEGLGHGHRVYHVIVFRRVSAGAGRSESTPEDRRHVDRLGPLPRPLALAVLALWVVVTAIAGVATMGQETIRRAGVDGLIPVEHRRAQLRLGPVAILRVDPVALAELERARALDPEAAASPEDAVDPRAILAEAGFAIEEALGEERVPHAPPKTEITRWLDTHALYLLPIETHAELDERLGDAAMLAEVQGMESRMSSPLFSVSGEQPRRDPLGLAELSQREAGRLGHVATAIGTGGPQVAANGDLTSADGGRRLIQLVSDRPSEALRTDILAAVSELPVEVAVVDGSRGRARVREALSAAWPRVAATGLALLVLLHSLLVRRAIPVLVLAACLVSGWLILVWVADGLDLLGLPMAIALLGLGCQATVVEGPADRVGLAGWATALILVAAFVPLALTPYPLWRAWGWIGPLATLALVAILRLVAPALLELLGHGSEPGPSATLRPWPAIAGVSCAAAIALGVWAAGQIERRAITELPTATAERDVWAATAEDALTEHFYDPAQLVEARSEPADQHDAPSPEAAALDAAALDFARLAELVPEHARRIDSPGSFILPRAELEARHDALARLKLPARMEKLDALLVDQGLRSEAFTEFVRGSADIETLPGSQVALDGPLGPWIGRYVVRDGESPAIRTWVELRPDTALDEAALAELPELRGPMIAAILDRGQLVDRAAIVALAGLWLAAFATWLGTRRLAVAIAVAITGVAALGVVAGVFVMLKVPAGADALPVLAVVIATAGITGARAAASALAEQPIALRETALAAAGSIVAGLALASAAQPAWRELGLALACGCAAASVLGLFAAPGLARLFSGRAARTPRPQPNSDATDD